MQDADGLEQRLVAQAHLVGGRIASDSAPCSHSTSVMALPRFATGVSPMLAAEDDGNRSASQDLLIALGSGEARQLADTVRAEAVLLEELQDADDRAIRGRAHQGLELPLEVLGLLSMVAGRAPETFRDRAPRQVEVLHAQQSAAIRRVDRLRYHLSTSSATPLCAKVTTVGGSIAPSTRFSSTLPSDSSSERRNTWLHLM